MTLAQDIARGALSVPPVAASLPLAGIKRHLVDAIGCAAFGSALPYASALVSDLARPTGFGVIGKTVRMSPGDAAFQSGVYIGAFELDTAGAFVHPAASIVPAALVAAQMRLEDGAAVSGEAFLRATAVAYEMTVRVAEWVGFLPERYIGWHTPAFHGAIGGALAAGLLLELDEVHLARAVAFAADMAGGGLIHARGNAKRFHQARTAQTGITSALLAARGIECGLDVLEDPRWGYRRAMTYSGEGDAPTDQGDLEAVTAGFGSEWRAWARLGIKYYPFHASGQTILDNGVALRAEGIARSEDIVSATVGTTTFIREHDQMLKPATGLADANFSLPYAAAVGLALAPAPLNAERSDAAMFATAVDDPEVQRLQRLVILEVDSELDRENSYTMDTVMTVRTRDGQTHRHRTDYGSRGRSEGGAGGVRFAELGDDDISRKFSNLAAVAWGDEHANRVLASVLSLEQASSVDELLDQLHTESRTIPGAGATKTTP